jgi:hypothetical protein
MTGSSSLGVTSAISTIVTGSPSLGAASAITSGLGVEVAAIGAEQPSGKATFGALQGEGRGGGEVQHTLCVHALSLNLTPHRERNCDTLKLHAGGQETMCTYWWGIRKQTHQQISSLKCRSHGRGL